MQLSASEISIGIITIILTLLALWFIPKWQVRSLKELHKGSRIEVENDSRKILAEILGGTFVLIGIFLTWQTIKSNGENLRISQEQLRLSQEGQITERFTRAIEQLGKIDPDGKENYLAIRLGGIHALERLAKDSEKDHWPIMEVLTAYVRQHAPWREQNKNQSFEQALPPQADIQAILNVIGRRTRSYKKGEDQPLDLSGTDLRRAILNRGNFNGVDFTGSHLEGARLQGTLLEGANLTGANLWGAVLDDAHLGGANLTGAIFIEASLKGATGLGKGQLESAITDNTTRLSENR